MSYLTDIKDVFEAIHAEGTFLFYSEVYADNYIMSVAQENYPIFVIDDEINTEAQINYDANGQIIPRLKIYCLTKFRIVEDEEVEVNEGNTTRLEQFEGCVKPMETLAIRVMAKYMREYPSTVLRDSGTKPRMSIKHHYNIWGSALYGVEMDVLNLILRENINYCDI